MTKTQKFPSLMASKLLLLLPTKLLLPPKSGCCEANLSMAVGGG